MLLTRFFDEIDRADDAGAITVGRDMNIFMCL
jgi:hypothetical protein